MDCPVCTNVKLVMSDRQGIEIDYCPTCRGVWLDRGELDKIIDRSADLAAQPVQRQGRREPHQEQTHQPQGFAHSQKSHDYPQQAYPRKKKREGFLGELFDFD